uniref:MIF4G domain-containing protein n=1 Tax=Peronospora matthiolae TaxID=2874970 RepID=A0AAV1UJB2_9STRA
MTRLNPNAGEWVPPTFGSAPVATTFSPKSVATTSILIDEKTSKSTDQQLPIDTPPITANEKTPLTHVTPTLGHDVAVDANGDCISYEGYSLLQDRFIYSREYLLAFQVLGDRVIKSIPDVVRNPSPVKKIGCKLKGRLVYTIAELLLFEPLYEMMPEGFTWADTIGADAVMDENKGKKSKKDKYRQQHGNVLSYDASLVCYFNPTEYSAAMNMGLYTGPATETTSNGTDGRSTVGGVEPVNLVEEATIARRRIAALLDDVKPDSVISILESFTSIVISCTHTLQEMIDQLFDRAIANPELSDSYAKLCTGMSERTPEFKDGAKTINFRRILLTKCYESLIEEPESQPSHHVGKKIGNTQHSWRRKCMLQNVGFIGELFRRQLLTENIMHVCVAMMLDDEVKPQPEIIEAACGLLTLVGDLLDGSSPASRRTMDEYFEVLVRIQENCELPDRVKKLISDLKTVRACGWLKTRRDSSSASSAPASPTEPMNKASNGPITLSQVPNAVPATGNASLAET